MLRTLVIGILGRFGETLRFPVLFFVVAVLLALNMAVPDPVPFLDGQTAFDWGLVSHVVDDDALMETARQVARDMLGLQPHMLPAMKKVIDDGFAMPFGDAMPMESERSRAQIREADAWRGAGAAFSDVRDRGRSQNG